MCVQADRWGHAGVNPTAAGQRSLDAALGCTGNALGSPRLLIEQLCSEHLPELATHLRQPLVYQHIGGTPSLDEFILDRERALAGPGEVASNERWLNFLVRERASRQMLGRLEATLHDAIAEVAFLFSPNFWGKGYASEALEWLHTEIQGSYGIANFWATTVPENSRCQALLRRIGYRQVNASRPTLYSFETGDLMFHLRGAALPLAQADPLRQDT